jgi:hypothetical protein
MDCNLIKSRGHRCKFPGIDWKLNYFTKIKSVSRVHAQCRIGERGIKLFYKELIAAAEKWREGGSGPHR